MKKLLFLSSILLVASLIYLFPNSNDAQSSGMYCRNMPCSGSSGEGVYYLYDRVSCISMDKKFYCNAGTIEERSSLSSYVTNQPQGQVCFGKCIDIPSDSTAPGGAGYPLGHQCELQGKVGTYECQATPSDPYYKWSFVLISTPAPTIAPQPNQPSVINKTPKPTANPEVSPTPTTIQVNQKKLPESFNKTLSKSTDLSSISEDKLSSYANFILDDPKSSSIQFIDPINFTEESLLLNIEKLDSFIKLGSNFIEVDSNTLSQFSKISAKLTFYEVELDPENIMIKKDGVDAKTLVKNVEYNESKKELTFEVSGFSRYEVVEKENDEKDITVTERKWIDSDNSKQVYAIIVGFILISTIITVGIIVLFLKIIFKRVKSKKK